MNDTPSIMTDAEIATQIRVTVRLNLLGDADLIQAVQRLAGGNDLGDLESPIEEARRLLDDCTNGRGIIDGASVRHVFAELIMARNKLAGRSIKSLNVVTGEVTR